MNPTPEQIRVARYGAHQTQLEAGAMIFASMRSWQDYESGARRMHPAIWAWYLVATGQHPTMRMRAWRPGKK